MPLVQHKRPRPRHGFRPPRLRSFYRFARRPVAPLAGATVFLSAALAITTVPGHAIDVAKRDIPIILPDRIDGRLASPVALSAKERDYFIRYGGAAAKAAYGDASVLAVRTSSPLRHLHAPDECLRGLGLDIDYLGMRHGPVPTAIYRAQASDGRAWRIEVSFVSDRGHAAANVAHVVWTWLQQPATVWTSIQRITPWEMPAGERQDFEHGVIAAFDLPTDGQAWDQTIETARL